MKDDSLEVLLQRQRDQILDNVSGEEEQEEMQRTVSEVWANFRRMEKSLAEFETELSDLKIELDAMTRDRDAVRAVRDNPKSEKTPTLGDLGCASWGNAAVPGGAGVPFDEQDASKPMEELRRIIEEHFEPFLKKYKLTVVDSLDISKTDHPNNR